VSDRSSPKSLSASPRRSDSDDRLTWKVIAALFVVALAARATWGIYNHASRGETAPVLEFPDEQQYWMIAESLASGNGMRDELGFRASRMPLYPALLSAFARFENGVFLAKVLHWLLGALCAVLAATLAARLFDRRVGCIAGVLVAMDPFLVFSSSLLLTETPFILAMLLLFVAVAPLIVLASPCTRGKTVEIGLLSALCVHIRESSLGLIALLLILVAARRGFDRATYKLIGGILFLVAATLLPWMLRNNAILGEPVWLTTRGGISLFDGVGAQADGTSDLGEIKAMPAVAGLPELKRNEHFWREALRAIRHDPRRVAQLATVKIRRMWNPVPNVETYQSLLVRSVAAAWSIPTFALAIAGAIILVRRREGVGAWIAALLIVPAVYFTALHSLFVGSVRYRLPAVVTLEILTAAAILAMWVRHKSSVGTDQGDKTR
jgi:4-amino-4-deoxy-L-arabinose transferase-like glycosyltransferase